MSKQNKNYPKEKSVLHPRNKHRNRYDFNQLMACCPELAAFVKLNAYHDLSIDFFNPQAVKMLNKALLKYYYDIVDWDIPPHYLCAPIPGRADYIHHIADLLASCHQGIIPKGDHIKCLDIGVGANCVYPIIGVKEYGWPFIGADIDPIAIQSANRIIQLNKLLQDKIEIRQQNNPDDIFLGIIQKNECIDVTLCNPPFHASLAEASAGTLRKLNNLTRKKMSHPILNFGGKSNELWCEGGEKKFVSVMIRQSKQFSTSCFWFSTLVSKQAHLKSVYEALKKENAVEIKTILMGQGSKISRIVAWTFLEKEQQNRWIHSRWSG